ncbi:MAG: hypothetical protein ABF893_06340 [Gluconacetobacter liquefaciens]
MARLSKFTRHADAITDGTEVEVGPKSDRFILVTRGMTDAYSDRLWELRRLATIEYNAGLTRDDVRAVPQDLPPSIDDRCVAQALGEKCLIDVRDLEGDDGAAITIDAFRDMITRRENVILLRLTLEAVSSVGTEEKKVLADAEKN